MSDFTVTSDTDIIASVTGPAQSNFVLTLQDGPEFVIDGTLRGATGPKGDPGTTDYNELENLPTLGTAAAKDEEYFAKSATTYTKDEIDQLWINVKHHGAVGDGSVNESTAVNAVLAGGNKRVYFPAGTYRFDAYMRVYSNTDILLHPDAVLQNNIPGNSAAPLLLNGERGNTTYATEYNGESNITVRGGTFDCALRSAIASGSESMAFGHAQNITIDGVRFINNKQDHQIEFNACRDSRIVNCIFENSTITSPGSREFINIDYSFEGGFPQFGSYDDTPCENILIANNTFINGDIAAGSHSQGPIPHKNIQYLNNRIKDMITSGIEMNYSIDCIASENYIDNAGVRGIRARSAVSPIIKKNRIIGGCTANAIQALIFNSIAPSGVVISRNIIRNILSPAINVYGDASSVDDNTITCPDISTDYGIKVQIGIGGSVKGNTIEGYDTSIAVLSSTDKVVSDNVLLNYASNGVQIGDSSIACNNTLVTANRMSTDMPGSVHYLYVSSTGINTVSYGNNFRNGGAIYDQGTNTILTPYDIDSVDVSRRAKLIKTGSVDLNDYVDSGTYLFLQTATIANLPAGNNGFMQVISYLPEIGGPSGQGRVKQIWYRSGTLGTNDWMTYVRTRNEFNVWGSWYTILTSATPIDGGSA